MGTIFEMQEGPKQWKKVDDLFRLQGMVERLRYPSPKDRKAQCLSWLRQELDSFNQEQTTARMRSHFTAKSLFCSARRSENKLEQQRDEKMPDQFK
ncbi:hypothetical protein EK904_011795, partial [Melospiza melodia maxima]